MTIRDFMYECSVEDVTRIRIYDLHIGDVVFDGYTEDEGFDEYADIDSFSWDLSIVIDEPVIYFNIDTEEWR